jgi:spore maturation protein SpmA
MVLNVVWIAFVLVGIALAGVRAAQGDAEVFQRMLAALFDAARTGFDVSIGLVGVMCLWLGLMRIGERAGMIDGFARALAPLFRRLFPAVPPGHPAGASMAMNVGANLLGLDNAATPLGLKAMRELQQLNPRKDEASDPMIMFLVLNTAGLTLIPTSVIAIRQSLAVEQGLAGFNAADIFLPTLCATFVSFSAGLVAVARCQRIRLLQGPIVALFGAFGALGLLLFATLRDLPAERVAAVTGAIGGAAILLVVASFVAVGALRRVDVYGAFVEGAKDGFGVAIGIVPYLVAMLVAIALFRASGGMDAAVGAVSAAVSAFGLDTAFVPALPVGLMKTLSGSGARGLMVDVMKTWGVDSFQGRLAAIVQGSTETTFYVLAVYFGSVDVRRTRHAVGCALFADAVGLVGAILIAYAFYG